MKSIINKAALFFVLWDNIFLPINVGFDFRLNYLVMLGYILYYILTHKKITISPKKLVYFSAGVLLVCSINFAVGISYFLILKQLILIFITFLFSYLLINSYQFDIKKIFKDYTDIIFLAAIVVVIQLIGVMTNLSFLIDFSYLGFDTGGIVLNAPRGRFHSWFYEPSFMAYAFVPVVFASLSKLFRIGNLISLPKAIFIIIIFLMTQSSVGFLGLLLSISLIGFSKYPIIKRPIVLFFILFSFVVGTLLIYRIPPVKLRVDHTYELFFTEDITAEKIIQTNLSTYALYSNYKITQTSFMKNPFFGTGIGTYELNYDIYLNEVIPLMSWREYHKLNRQDANSLLFRILVEMGAFGLFCVLYFIFSYRIKFIDSKRTDFKQYLWVINNGIFVLILLRLLRQGHYTMLGFLMLIIIYFISYKQAKSLNI